MSATDTASAEASASAQVPAPTRTQVRSEGVDARPLPPSGRENRLVVSEIALAVAIVLGWGLLYLVVLSGFQAGHTQSRLYPELRSALAEGVAPTGAPIAAGTPVALLDIPGAGLRDEVVVEGATSSLLRGGAGHVRGSVLPGQVGTSVVQGRSLSFGAPFGSIAALPVGSQIAVTTQQGAFTYRVIGVRRAGAAVPTLAAGAGRLVLVTADGHGLSRSGTVYVDADLVGKVAPAGAVAAVDPADAPMSRDTGVVTVALLALALQVLILAAGWAVWARLRWSLVAAWTTGLPAVLAALWLVSSVGSRLLPSLV
ncbi:sortase [Nocardioides sp.]|uniref:sortase domain-containing protein n=1 Tax=Nocardioides sp. TaxID=35761 RepID=UPI00261DBB25|nr:sortase [Nocardioides sp.]